MDDTLSRIANDLVGRLDGPLHFRFILQPLMATIFAVKDGLKDAREGRVAYFWGIFTQPGHRMDLIKRGWKSVGKIFILALVLEVVYQIWQLHTFYPGEALIVALLLAIVPYLLIRGPVNRIMSRRH
jgi:hypothetical protein